MIVLKKKKELTYFEQLFHQVQLTCRWRILFVFLSLTITVPLNVPVKTITDMEIFFANCPAKPL